MSFTLPAYRAPDFTALGLEDAPEVQLVPVERDGVAPAGYHATTMFPEYFRLKDVYKRQTRAPSPGPPRRSAATTGSRTWREPGPPPGRCSPS